jgi:hypothetical protein
VIAVIATAYLLTAILCLVCIILILFQQQLKQLHVFYFIMLPLLLSTFSFSQYENNDKRAKIGVVGGV